MIAQDPTKHPGSIIRIHLDGKIPKDNPKFKDKKTWKPEIYQIGVRNPQGMDLSPFDNKIYLTNHGAKGGDWFGEAKYGENYGWKILGWGGTNYTGSRIGPKWKPGFTKAIKYWVPSIAVSSMVIYKGSEFEEWNGHALITSLRDQSLRKIKFKDNEFLEEKIIFKGIIGRIRDIEIQESTGKIYLLTDEGFIWRLQKVKKIFILTGEASGDKLASKVISELNTINSNIEYLSVGGENLEKLGIRTIYDLKEITYLGFTNVLINIFKIKKKINETVKAIENFEPDILLTVDSPDFTLRVAEKVKLRNPNIKTIHYVAPQVWVWREGRVKKIKKFIDHILLLFNFEKSYFEKENMSHEFVGHPLLDPSTNSAIDINQILGKNKALISIFAGSRKSEIDVLTPILLNFIKLMNKKYNDFSYVFHATKEYSDIILSHIKKII